MKFFLIVISVLALVLTMVSNASYAAVGIGSVASHMLEPVGLFSDFVMTGCFVIGGSFVFASLIKYIEHKRSPLMVPISTVVFLLVAGLVLILLPFLSLYLENGVHYSFFN